MCSWDHRNTVYVDAGLLGCCGSRRGGLVFSSAASIKEQTRNLKRSLVVFKEPFSLVLWGRFVLAFQEEQGSSKRSGKGWRKVNIA